MENNKEVLKYEWDKRTHKLILHGTRTEKDSKTNTDKVVEIKEIHNKESAKKLQQLLKMQFESYGKFINVCEEKKKSFENMKELPMYNEFKDLMNAYEWNSDRKLQAQYDEALTQFKTIKEQHEQIKDMKFE